MNLNMSKYINADLLRKEIEKNKNIIDGLFTEGDDSVYDGEDDAYNRVLRIIDSLQQEQQEVDLDSKLSEFMSFYAYENSGEYPSTIDIARHFYELGRFNARKEE